MFASYKLYHRGQYFATVNALTELSARQKGAEMIGFSASRYSGALGQIVAKKC